MKHLSPILSRAARGPFAHNSLACVSLSKVKIVYHSL
jgi:hypothetical protein